MKLQIPSCIHRARRPQDYKILFIHKLKGNQSNGSGLLQASRDILTNEIENDIMNTNMNKRLVLIRGFSSTNCPMLIPDHNRVYCF